MTPDERFAEDPVLARVALARPAIPEDDLSPVGERATMILDRVLATPGPREQAPSPRRRRSRREWLRWPSGLGVIAVAAVVAALVFVVVGINGGKGSHPAPTLGTHAVPAADAIHLQKQAKLPSAMLRVMDRTALGRAIAAQFPLIQENVETGTPAQNRQALLRLQLNQAACLHAAAVVAAVPVTPAQRYIQYDWVQGTRMQAHADALDIAALRAFAAGDRKTGERIENRAGNLSNVLDLYTAYAENQIAGEHEPVVPHVPGIRGPSDSH